MKEVREAPIRMPKIDLYTDGACKGNPGPGGWGAILIWKGIEKILSGGESQTTNNRMELLGVINALEALKRPCDVTLTTDSRYVVDGLSKGWAESWKKRGWKKADGKPALNADLWERLLIQVARHKLTYIWVRGHAGHAYNERCDALAVMEAEKHR